MSLKAELDTWASALKAYDEEDFEKSLDLFSRIADSSKILTNMGLIYATLGEHEAAVERFVEATGLDQFLAVAYFQCGVSNFLLARYELAHKDFDEALLYLRGNQAINYEQLGLKFKLFSAEVLFNKGLARIYLGNLQEGLRDMEDARACKATDEHNVIDDAIQDRGEGYTVFSIPVGVLYRPSEKKLKNAVTKDYLGKAKLVATSDLSDTFTTFSGVEKLKQGISPSNVFIEGPIESSTPNPGLGRAASVPGGKPTDSSRYPRERSNTSLGRNRDLASESTSPGVSRANTFITPARASPNATIGGPARGLSIRRPTASPTRSAESDKGPPVPVKAENPLTEIYDDYIDSYSEAPQPGNNNGPPDRVAAWARTNATGNYPPSRYGSRSAPASNYAPSSFGGGSLRRKVSRRPTQSRAPSSRIQSSYDEEEEGYVSGDYDDGLFELVKIRVKLHYQDEVRGMALAPEMTFDEFLDKVTSKFGKSINGLTLKFKDEDGGQVTLRDDMDYELAIETARESSKGRPEGRLEIWCADA